MSRVAGELMRGAYCTIARASLGDEIAYLILQAALLRAEGEGSRLRVALGSDAKGKISTLLYCLGIPLAFANRWIGLAMYVAVAPIWLVPDRRVERHLTTASAEPGEQARHPTAALTAPTNRSMSSSVVSQEHIQRTSSRDSSQT
jgi:hypothetical protein